MIVTAGAGVYWISASQIAQSKQDSTAAVAKSVALGISAQINLLTDILEKMAQDPEVLAAVTSADTAQLISASEKLEKHLPFALKVRLLLPGVSELDDKSIPKMGYADLDMVRETFSKNQLPAIQGDSGPDRHLAVTRRIMQNGQVVGVILASLKYDFISKIVEAAELKNGHLELRQATLVLGAAGGPVSAEQGNDLQVPVANTGWQLHYQYIDSASFENIAIIAGTIGISAVLSLLAFFMGYRKLSAHLTHDLGSVLKACKDMMTNKLQGTYPVKLAEVNLVISTLAQFKRVLDNEHSDKVDVKSIAEMNDFFADFDDFMAAPASDSLVTFSPSSEIQSAATPETKAAEQRIEQSPNAPDDNADKPAIPPNKPEIVEKTVPDFFEMPVSTKKNHCRQHDFQGL